jgi:hypothetical protein
MIVRWPDVPSVEGLLKLPKPAVFLMGSYDKQTGLAGDWYEQAARYLDRYVGTIFYGVHLGQPALEEFLQWYFYWLQLCDVVVVWIEQKGSRLAWSQFEVGWVFGTHLGAGEPEILVGVHPSLEILGGSLEIVGNTYGLNLNIYNDLPTLLHAARDVARRFR